MYTDQGARRRRVTLLLLAVGISCGALGLYAHHRTQQRLGFETISGRVLNTRAYQSGDLWYLDIEFTYQAAANAYVKHETRLLRERFKDEAEALSSAGTPKPGARVDVYYDPKQPNDAVLEQRHRSLGFFAMASALWLILALLWFIYDRTRQRN